MVRDQLEELGRAGRRWLDKPPRRAPNPYADVDTSRPWPVPGHRRGDAAAGSPPPSWCAPPTPTAPDEGLDMVEAARVAEWDAELDAAAGRGPRRPRRRRSTSRCRSLSATAVARLRDDPDQFARELARPMPRQPSPAARFGTRFHAWVEARFGQQALLDPDELPGRGDPGHRRRGRPGRADRDASRPARSATGSRTRSSRRSRSCWPGRWSAAASTRCTPSPGRQLAGRRLEDQPPETADPLQLALYRVAWAELTGVPLERVAPRSTTSAPARPSSFDDLPDRGALEKLLADVERPAV